MSILRHLTDRSWRGKIYFINAIRSQEDRIYEAELSNLARRFGNLHVLTYFSQSQPSAGVAIPASRWQEKSGYINARPTNFCAWTIRTPNLSLRPEPMMQAVRKTAVSIGVPNDQISTEEFVSPRGTAQRSNRPRKVFLRAIPPAPRWTCNRQPSILTYQGKLWISMQGLLCLKPQNMRVVALPWECRAGVCGQCKVRCTSGRVRMESRDALTKTEEANG